MSLYDTLIIFGAKYLIVFPFIVLFGYFILAPGKVKQKMALLSLISMTLAYALARVAGDLYDNPRPFVVGHFTPLVAHAADNGFPSDHMLFAATVASILFYFNKRTGIALWIIAILIAYSRVAAGVHHTIDTVASAAIAVVAVLISAYIVQQLPHRKSIEKEDFLV